MTKEKRSKIMSAIRSKDTKPELLVRKFLFANGFRYRTQYKVHGKPDIAFPRKKIAIFINGCFWHQHECLKNRRVNSNSLFWDNKFGKNIERDARNTKLLENDGWKVIKVWECELKKSENQTLNNLLIQLC